MSKRSERREAERLSRKLAYQQLRSGKPQSQHLAHAAAQLDENIHPEAADCLAPESFAPEETLAAEQTVFAAEPTLTAAAHPENETDPQDQPETPSQISEAQLAANRANAQLSTGPRTPAGRAASSRNALTHALTGKLVLLPNEDPARYQSALDAYLAHYQPATEEELRLVQSQRDCLWRLNRIQRLEAALFFKGSLEFANKFDDRPQEERHHFIEAETYLKYEKQMRNLNIQEARLRRTMEKDRLDLVRLQAQRRREESAAATAATRAQNTRTATAPAKSTNGFDFSTQSNPPAANTSHHPKQQRRAA